MNPKAIPVVLDTDIGGDIDDTWALAMLLGCPELDLKLVLTEAGDTVYRAKIAAKFLDIAGRSDVAVAIGIAHLMQSGFFQEPWVTEYALEGYPGTVHTDGVQALIELVMASLEPVTIIAIGVVTNLAEALRREPRIAQKCRFVGMHGSIHVGYGGSAGAVPEANVKGDPQALREVLAAPWLEKIITPLDTCGLVVLEGDRYQSICQHDSVLMQALMENYRIWADRVTWMTVDFVDQKSSTLFDTVAVYLAYASDLVEMQELPLSISPEGLTLIDENGDRVQAAMRWLDLDQFYEHMVTRLLWAAEERK